MRAIVVGGGIAGLVAARVLSDHVAEVVIVDRDRLVADGGSRSGTPQAAHVHVLLRRGFVELARIFPGLDARLADVGAMGIDWTRDVQTITPAGTAPRFASGIVTRALSRDLLERTLRDLVAERPGIRIMDQTEVTGLIGNTREVTGVVARTRPGDHAPPGQKPARLELTADLVIDASGRSSRMPEMLTEIGGSPPTESVLDASLAYATRVYRIPADPPDWKVLIVRDRPPSGTRGGVVFPIEGGRWVVTLGGAGTDRPPTDEAGLEAFAGSLIDPALADVLARSEPMTAIRGWARTANRLRHFDALPAWPAGLALVGDAICALNPVYGQGMSVAALEGAVLAGWLRSAPVSRSLAANERPNAQPLLRDLGRAVRTPWLMATSEDARIMGMPRAPGASRLVGTMGGYVQAVQDIAARDPFVLRRFVEVLHLLRSPAVLLDPRIAARVGMAHIRRPQGAVVGGRP